MCRQMVISIVAWLMALITLTTFTQLNAAPPARTTTAVSASKHDSDRGGIPTLHTSKHANEIDIDLQE